MTIFRGWLPPICAQQLAPGLVCGKPAAYVYLNHGHAPDWAMCAGCRDALVAWTTEHTCPEHLSAALAHIAPLN